MSTLDEVLKYDEDRLEAFCNRFLNNTTETEDGCMLWKGSIAGSGYARLGLHGISIDIHVFIATCFLLERDEREQSRGMLTCHSCDIRDCIAPWHLFFGDKSSNALDAVSKGLWPVGEGNLLSKLTKQQADEIKQRWAEGNLSQTKIAKMYGISQSNVSYLVRGKTWK